MRGEADTVVVGAGIVGLAAAFTLRERGVDVLCLDAGPPGGEQSFGRGRIFRHSHEDPALVELARDAIAGWRRWEERLGVELLGREGHLLAGESMRSRAELLHGAGLEAVELDGHAIERRWPGFLPGLDVGFLDPGGGAIRAEAAIDALASEVGVATARVERLERRDHEFLVGTTAGECRCRRLVLSAGAGTPELAAQLGVEVVYSSYLTVRVSFARREGSGALPCLSDRSGLYGETVYAVVVSAAGDYGVGLVELDLPEEAAVARCVAYVERALPCLDPEPLDVVARRSVTLAGGQDAMTIERRDGLTVFAGHNAFKFAPSLGALVADEPGAGIAFGG